MKTQSLLAEITEHKKTIDRLLGLIHAQRIPHSMLFVGAHGPSQRSVALAFAQILLCERKEIPACGECSSCRGVRKGQGVGLLVLEPEKGVIKIDSARAIVKQLAFTTWARARVVIIDGAHLLNAQAANALLKSLEEPPPQTYFIMISPSQESVLKTIRSRSQIIRFGHVQSAEKETPEAAMQILNAILQKNKLLALESSRENIDSRETALTFTRAWLQEIRNEWHDCHWGVDREKLSRLSELVLTVEKDLTGHCDLQLTLENALHEMGAVI